MGMQAARDGEGALREKKETPWSKKDGLMHILTGVIIRRQMLVCENAEKRFSLQKRKGRSLRVDPILLLKEKGFLGMMKPQPSS